MTSFPSPHPELGIRKPQAVSTQRGAAFYSVKADKFHDLIEETVYGNDGQRQYHLPKYSVLMRLNFLSCRNHPNFVQTGRKYASSFTSAERGRTATAVCWMSATGMYVPPMVIFL
jgi:hypothetical protein